MDIDFNGIDKIKDISKNSDKTKRAISGQSAKIKKIMDMKDFYEKYALSENQISRAKVDGYVTLRLVSAFAAVLSVNPYFLIGTSTKFNEYSEKLFYRFLTEHGYEFPAEPKIAENENGGEEEKEGPPKPDEPEPDAETDESPAGDARDITAFAAHQQEYIEILRTKIEKKLASITSYELERIKDMPEKKALELLKSMYLRSEYDDDLKRISVIVILAMLL